jgi:hypothetical protein
VKHILVTIAAFGVSTGFALAQSASPAPIAPSAVIAGATTYDTQTIAVTGTVKGVQTRTTERGSFTQYQLCDTQCVNVVQIGDASNPVTEGETTTVTGRFRANVDRGPMKAQNVLVVGMRHGMGRGGENRHGPASPAPTASPGTVGTR